MAASISEKEVGIHGPVEPASPPSSPTSTQSEWSLRRISSMFGRPLLSRTTRSNSDATTQRSSFFLPWRTRSDQVDPSIAERSEGAVVNRDVVTSGVRSLKTAPKGYPSLATFLDSDEQFMMFRRFGFVQTRLLLEKQEEIGKLEAKLDELDRKMERKDKTMLMSLDMDDEDELVVQREELMPRLEKAFNEYAILLSSAAKLVALNRPANSDHRSVLNYMDARKPVEERERCWIKQKEDLVTLRPGRENAWLDAGVEHVLRRLDCRLLRRLFCSKETQMKGDGIGAWYTRSRIDRFVVGIITLFILILLIVPIYILFHLVDSIGTDRTDSICVGVLLVFTLAFSTVLSLFTRAQRHEILGAAAAYCAVLVVFLSNVPNHGK